MTLLRALASRLASLIVFILLLATAMFFMIRLTGDPATAMAGANATSSQVDAINRLYGFDESLWVQYGSFIRQFVLLDFGTSFLERRPVMEVVTEPLLVTLTLCGLVMVFNIAIATPLGLYLGRKRQTWTYRIVHLTVLGAQAVQSYIMGLLLLAVFSLELELFPAVGIDSWKSWVLPTASLVWLVVPRLARVVASAAEEAWAAEYTTFSTAYGYAPRTVRWKTIAPNVGVPLVAAASTQFTLLLSGAVLIEGLFGMQGIGQQLISSVQDADFPVTVAAVVLIGIVVFVVTTIAELTYQYIDPRTR